MAVTAWLSPTDQDKTNDIADATTTDLYRARIDDDIPAELTVGTGAKGTATDSILYKGFGFNIPAGSRITGVEARVRAYRSATETAVADMKGRPSPNNVGVGENTTNLIIGSIPIGSAGDVEALYTSSVWTTYVLTEADVNDPDFGIVFLVNGATVGETIYLDHIEARITYIPPLEADSVAHGHEIESPAIAHAYDVAPEDVDSPQTVSSPTLVQAHTITPADLLANSDLDAVVIGQIVSLVPNLIYHLVATGEPSFNYTANPDALDTPQGIDPASIAEAGILSVADLVSGQQIAAATLAQLFEVSPDGVGHIVGMGPSEVAQGNTTARPADILSSVAIGEPILGQNSEITVADLIHNTDIGEPGISVAYVVTPDGVYQVPEISIPDLVAMGVLSPDSLSQNQTLESAFLSAITVLGELDGELVICVALGGDLLALPSIDGFITTD